MSQLTSPPTNPTIPQADAGSTPATTPHALMSRPGHLYFSAPAAGPTSPAAAEPRAMVSRPGQLYFSVPIAEPTGTAAVTAYRRPARRPVIRPVVASPSLLSSSRIFSTHRSVALTG